MDLGTHLRDKHGHLFLCELELFWLSFKAGQTHVENMHFCQLSQNCNFKADLDTHLKDRHEHLFFDESWTYFGPSSRLVNQGLKYVFLPTFSELSFESRFQYPYER